MSVSLNLQRGRTFVRGFILSHNRNFEDHASIAAARWGVAAAERIAKAASAITLNDAGSEEAREFLDLVAEQSVVGKLGLRRIPFNVRLLRMTAGATGYWVGQAAPKPVSKPAMQGDTLVPLKAASIILVTKEALTLAGPLLESGLQRDLERAVALTIDQAFLDPGNAGIANETPAAATYGANSIAATGDMRADLARLIAAFNGDFASAAFVIDPTTAVKIALITSADGSFLFPDAGPRGGTVLGLPLIVSRASPHSSSGGQIALIDGSAIALGMEGFRLERAEHATVDVADDPGSPTTQVSLFQTNTVGLLSETFCNWDVQRSGAVAVLTDVL